MSNFSWSPVKAGWAAPKTRTVAKYDISSGKVGGYGRYSLAGLSEMT